jgi:PilZ domain-containing protein
LDETAILELREGGLPERRQSRRQRALKSATIVCKYYDVKCQILDFSDGGVLLRPADVTLCPNQFSLETSTASSRTCEVVWRGQTTIGVRYCE